MDCIEEKINSLLPTNSEPLTAPAGEFAEEKSESLEWIVKSTPPTYKIARRGDLAISKAESNIVETLSNVSIADFTKKISSVTPYEFASVYMALAQLLYNTSVMHGNEELNSGDGRFAHDDFSQIAGYPVYYGSMKVSQNEIGRAAFGVDELNSRQRAVIELLLKAGDSHPIPIDYLNGRVKRIFIWKLLEDEYGRTEQEEVFYKLLLSPIFTIEAARNFGELPQDAMRKLKNVAGQSGGRLSAEHLALLRLLGRHKDTELFRRVNIGEFAKEIGIKETYYQKNRKLVEERLRIMFEQMEKIGLLESYTFTTDEKGRITELTAKKNPAFVRTEEAIAKRESKPKRKRKTSKK